MNTSFLLMMCVPLFDMFPWPPQGLDSCPLSCSPFEQGWLIVMHAWKVTAVKDDRYHELPHVDVIQ